MDYTLFFIQSQSFGEFYETDRLRQWDDLTFFVICQVAVSGFHRTAYGWEVVFRRGHMISHIFQHIASTLFRKLISSDAKCRPKGLCDMCDGRWI